jgi:hypothetical protein
MNYTPYIYYRRNPVKFKLIFILFNIVILFSFLIIIFMPLAMLGWEFTMGFWSEYWYLTLIFLVVMALLNAYFIMNWRLFSLLEREEWGGIIGYVRNRMKAGRIRSQEIRIGINAALVSSRLDEIGSFEAILREKKPSALAEFALPLGIPYLLNNDHSGAESYFQEFLEQKNRDRPWIIWSYGFSLLLQRRLEEATVQFLGLYSEKNPVLLLLSAYMLETCAGEDQEARTKKEEMVSRLREHYNRDTLVKQIGKAKSAVHVVILSKVIDEALEWLYPESRD